MKYRIEVSKTIVRKTIVEVDAPDDDTAKAAGLQRARANGGMDMVWLTAPHFLPMTPPSSKRNNQMSIDIQPVSLQDILDFIDKPERLRAYPG
jgi:hypothetical protein